MRNFSIQEALRFGWNKTKENFPFLLLVLVVSAIVGSIGSWTGIEPDFGNPFFDVLFIISLVLNVVISIGFIKIFLEIIDKNDSQIKSLFIHYRLFWKYLFTTILYVLIVGVGLVVFIIPGIYLALRYSMVQVLVIDKEMNVFDVFGASAHLTKGSRFDILLLLIVLAVLNMIGAALLGIGLIVTIPITTFAFLYVYRLLLRERGLESIEE